MFLTKEEFQQFWNADEIADARRGGLVVGRSHAEGNIYMIRQCANIVAYEDCSNMEGGEYIINHGACLLHKDRIEYINSFLFREYNVDMEEVCRTPLIITQRLDSDKDRLLLIDNRGQFIVNKHATCVFLKELNEINQSGLK